MVAMDAVGRYRMQERIGAGAFSTVWAAHDDGLDIPVAIKILSDNWSAHAEMRQRFVDEARLLRRIKDPRIISVYDIGQLPDGRDYFVMDRADGGTLADLAREPVPPATALRLCVELARAVAALHRNGVLHRDLKPANVLLTHLDGQLQPVLADLGTAKRLAEASGLTMAAGTPGYMAPEQARGLGLDERTDVYGVAAVCYRLLSGRHPFPEQSLAEIGMRPVDRRPEPLPAELGVPASLQRLLAAALSTDPAERPSSADELAQRLDAERDQLIRGPAVPAASSSEASGPSRVPALLSAAAVALLAAALTWLLLSVWIPR